MARSGARTRRSAASDGGSVRITAAHTSQSQQVRGRQTRYLISMGIRTLCFILAVVTDGAWRWGFIVAAVVLPYFAVIVANAGGEVDRDAPEPFVDDRRLMLESGPAHPEADGPEQQSDGPGQ